MGDAVNGKKLFMKLCVSCHTTEKGGKHKIGPNLHGIMGKTCGTISGFNSTETMKKKAIVWNEKTKRLPRISQKIYPKNKHGILWCQKNRRSKRFDPFFSSFDVIAF